MGYTQHTISSERHTVKDEVFNIIWHLKKQGYSEHTINFVRKALVRIQNDCNFTDPDTVKVFIAKLDVAESYKRNLCYAYQHYLKLNRLEWEKPKYYARDRLPRIPEERILYMLIASAYPSLALKLSISKETGPRPVELVALRVKDADLEKGIVYPATAKHGSARALKITKKTLEMLKVHIHDNNISINTKIFRQTSPQYSLSYRNLRRAISEKLKDPSIKTIRLYDLRHFFATKLYHQTKDILFVKAKMGHRKISTTLRYTQLVEMGDDSFTVKIASTIEEFSALLEQGFEYVSDFGETKVLRKRK
jgi:integrase